MLHCLAAPCNGALVKTQQVLCEVVWGGLSVMRHVHLLTKFTFVREMIKQYIFILIENDEHFKPKTDL